jgi:hypothetical protein
MTKPAVFVGSAEEGLPFARAVRSLLDDDAEVKLWNEGVFEPGSTFIDTLVNIRSSFDFAVFVFTADDWVKSRQTESKAPRDNVIFELGLFTGYLGRERSLIVRQRGTDLKIPSDLAGVTMSTFDWPRTDNSPEGALGKTCDTLRRLIREKGPAPMRLQQRQEILESKLAEQQALINKLVEASISTAAFHHLAGIYLLKRYIYRQDASVGELFQREFYHLKHHGLIGPETLEFDEHLHGANLSELAWPTETGKIYIDLRKSDVPREWLSSDPQKRENLHSELASALGLPLS